MTSFVERRQAPRDQMQKVRYWSARCTRLAIRAYVAGILVLVILTFGMKLLA